MRSRPSSCQWKKRQKRTKMVNSGKRWEIINVMSYVISQVSALPQVSRNTWVCLFLNVTADDKVQTAQKGNFFFAEFNFLPDALLTFFFLCTFQFNLLAVSSLALLSVRAEEKKVGVRNVKDLLFGAHPGALIQLTEVEIFIGGKWSTHTSHQAFTLKLNCVDCCRW